MRLRACEGSHLRAVKAWELVKAAAMAAAMATAMAAVKPLLGREKVAPGRVKGPLAPVRALLERVRAPLAVRRVPLGRVKGPLALVRAPVGGGGAPVERVKAPLVTGVLRPAPVMGTVMAQAQVMPALADCQRETALADCQREMVLACRHSVCLLLVVQLLQTPPPCPAHGTRRRPQLAKQQ